LLAESPGRVPQILVGEIANVINEKDDYEYFEGSYLPSEEDDATPQFQRYEQGLGRGLY